MKVQMVWQDDRLRHIEVVEEFDQGTSSFPVVLRMTPTVTVRRDDSELVAAMNLIGSLAARTLTGLA